MKENNEKKLFTDGFLNHQNDYSTTDYPELKSTTYLLGHTEYCIHCNKTALNIQPYIDSDNDYSVHGCRCNCDNAFLEMAETLAYYMGNFKFVRPLRLYTIDKKAYIKYLAGLDERSLPLALNRNTGHLKTDIHRPNAESFLDFWPNNKSEISFYINNSYYKDRDIFKFMSIVSEKIKEFKAIEEAALFGMIKSNSEIEENFSNR